MTTKTKGLLTVLTAYVIAVILGFISLQFSSHMSSMLQILIADIVATFVFTHLVYTLKIHLFMIHTGLSFLHSLHSFG